MSTPIDESAKASPPSTFGWFLAGVAATIVFVPVALFVIVLALALFSFPDGAFLSRLFGALHTMIYEFFTGRIVPADRSGVHSVILYHPAPKPPSKSDPSA